MSVDILKFVAVDDPPGQPNLMRRWWTLPLLPFGNLVVMGMGVFFFIVIGSMAGEELSTGVLLTRWVARGLVLAVPAWVIFRDSVYAWYQATTAIDHEGVRQSSWRGEKFIPWADLCGMVDFRSRVTLSSRGVRIEIYLPQFERSDELIEYIVARWWQANPAVFTE